MNYSIRELSGVPTLHIGDKTASPILYTLSDFPGARSNTAQAQRNIRNFAEAGIDLVSCDTSLHLGWHKVTPFDVEPLRSEIAYVLDANPNAKVFLRLHLNPPYWWLRDNPDECILYRTPEGDIEGIDDGEQDRLIRNDFEKHMRVSLASALWKEQATEKLTLFLEALKGTREGEALAAVQVACGAYGEWHQWGCDVSEPMKEYFRGWLREKYSTEDGLRKAWNDPAVTFDTAVFRPEPFASGDDGIYRDPGKSQNMIDAGKCLQSSVPDAILTFCRAVKAVMPNILCGAFYGYHLGTGKLVSGHLEIESLCSDESIDFFCGPFCYMKNRASDGVPMQRALIESHRLHGKLWLTEMDQNPVGTENIHGGDPMRFDETVAVLRRNAFQTLCAGAGFWYYDHRIVPGLILPDSKNSEASSIYRKKGWWDTPSLMAEIAKIQKVSETLTCKPYESAADVLVVYDTESYYHCSDYCEEEYLLHEALARSGVVFDCIYQKDIPLADTERYKCVIFANSLMITREDRALIESVLKGKMIIFLGSTGYSDGNCLSEDNISQTVGMTVKRTAEKRLMLDGDAYERQNYYPNGFAVTDPDAEVLAYWEGGEIASAIKGNRVFFPLPYLPISLAKMLLGRSDAHMWCDSGEPVIAGHGICLLNCQSAGERTLMLPGGKDILVKTDGFASPIYDLKTGEQIL